MSAAIPNPQAPPTNPVASPPGVKHELSLGHDGKMLPAIPSAAAVPEFLQKQAVGLSQARPEDIIHPRLIAVQDKSALVKNSAGQIPPGVLYHTGRKMIVAPVRTSIAAVPVTFAKGWIHWASRSSKKGVLGRTTDPDHTIAKRAGEQLLEKRNGKKFTTNDETYVESHDWLYYLIDLDDMVVCSYQVGGISESKKLIGSIASRNLSPCACVFGLSPDIKPNPEGDFFVVGAKFMDYNRDEPLFNRLYGLAKLFEQKGFKSADLDSENEAPVAGGDAPDRAEFS